jgi:adenosylcobyric acid synthase
MVLGTASHVGKSITTAALCRIFRDGGTDVAPFKAQNMALNSFATIEGLEIGRAQATQARAARLEPAVDMNPVLLKPSCDTASQVVLNGRILGNLSAAELYARHDELTSHIRAAYDRLASRHELIVLEGAGSPVEMNLKQHDMVNLAMAEYADARCVLVADIDRGGVFAQIIGTFALLEPHERARFAGFIINRFRGDAALLGDATQFIEEKTGQRCLGVVPWLHDIGIDEEDSLPHELPVAGCRFPRPLATGNRQPALRIAIVLLPSLANFTDFDPLFRIDGVAPFYARDVAELERADAIIIPGSKNTARDLRSLRDRGIAAFLMTTRKPIAGICGGFQMLGRTIDDPHGVESEERSIAGLGLLDVATTMAPVKTTRQVTARLGNATFRGYEIHVGETHRGNVAPLLHLDGIGPDGAISADGRVFGTYVHGLFDDPCGALAIVNHLRALLSMSPLDRSAIVERGDPYDRLAEHFRTHLDLEALS